MQTGTHPPQIDADRQKKAREYAQIRRRLSFINMAIAAIGILFIFWTGLDVGLRDQLVSLHWQPLTGWYPLQILVYFLILMLGYQIINAPLAYYGGFVLPHRYGLSTMTMKTWLLDLCKGLVIGLVLEICAVELVYALLATQPLTWWLWVALAMLFFSVVMANLAPVLLFPLFYKFTPLPEGDLTQRLLALANRAHTRVRGVYTMVMSNKTTAANAALMGLGNTRRIVVGDTMLDRYTPDEIEVVLAHELGHHVHHDIWKLIISQSLLTLGGLYLVNVALHWAVNIQNFYLSLADPATIPFVLVLTALFSLIVMPIGNSLSRAIEYAADEYALQSTRMIEPFKSAMTRLANQNLADIEPSPIVEILFHNHPSISKRLKHADAFAQRYALTASINVPSWEAVSSTEPPGMASSGSSTPDAAH
jgi:STE24 endopeptidase